MRKDITAEEILALIEQIIKEHRVMMEGIITLEHAANDASAITGLETAKGSFMPGRFDEKESLQKMQAQMEIVENVIYAHFNNEETRLVDAFKNYGDKNLVFALQNLLLDHEEIRNRFATSRNQVSELINGDLSRQIWEASAHDLRAHITHTRWLLGTHAGSEYELLMVLKRKLEQQ